MGFQLLIFGIWLLKCSILHPNHLKKSEDRVQGNLSRTDKHTQNQTKIPINHDNLELNNVDCVPSNAKFSRFGAMLYIFEDNETVIKMIIKGRTPAMRHVSRTDRVALDWLFDRINLDPKDSNQVHRDQTPTRRYIDKRELHT